MKNLYENWPGNERLPESYAVLLEEQKILNFWRKKKFPKTIQNNLRTAEEQGTLSFHYKPTLFTGSLHFGHLLNVMVKDIFSRYGFQRKLEVKSQFGWDCHGADVEHEVNKKLGIKTPQDMRKIGIYAYNRECRRFVKRRESEWINNSHRFAIWVDFERTYSTMSMEYMEGVWRIFKELFDKDLMYKDTKVLPYSTSGWTHLSNFETENNSKEVTAVGATISLNVVDSAVKLLIWTTSPWKLVVNVALCVNPNSRYVKVKAIASGNVYILAKNRLSSVFPDSSEFDLKEEILGEDLVNLTYRPLFEYSLESKCEKTFQVLVDEFVRDDIGTGIVALSPYFAEEDYRVCLQNGFVLAEDHCPIDDAGHFKEHILGLAGLNIHEANAQIIDKIKVLGELVSLQNIKLNKPHCWRSNVLLVRRLTSTWFMRIDAGREGNDKTTEVNWINSNQNKSGIQLQNCTDWAIGRKKYWGTPIPIWVSASGDEIVCVGSIDELLQLTGKTTLSDLHREFIDELQILSRIPGKPPLRRVSEVFDSEFEAAVMPFIQGRSQVDLTIEGSDETNGWFYTTAVLSTALSKPPPSRNIFTHGLVLHSDGSKLSKHNHNPKDFDYIVRKYGADAIRLYLASNPLVSGEHYTVQEKDIRNMNENIIKPIYTALRDLIPCFGKPGCISYPITPTHVWTTNTLDLWILGRTESMLRFYEAEMKAYRLHSIIPELMKYIAEVRDWYIAIRGRLSEVEHYGGILNYMVVFVFKTASMLAPFAPLFADYVFQKIKPFVHVVEGESVHITNFPEPGSYNIKDDIHSIVMRWHTVLEMVQKVRISNVIPTQYRIDELIVVQPTRNSYGLNDALKRIENIYQIRMSNIPSEFGVILKADLKENSPVHRWSDRTKLERVKSAIKELSQQEIEEALRVGSLQIDQSTILLDNIEITWEFNEEMGDNTAALSKDGILIIVRMKRNLNYYQEGTRLALINAIRKLKKRAKLFLSEPVTLYYSTENNCIREAFQKYASDISKSTNCSLVVKKIKENVLEKTVDILGVPVIMSLSKLE